MENLGRMLPTEVQRYTGAVDPNDTYELRVEQAAQARVDDAQTRKRRREEATTTTPSTVGSATPNNNERRSTPSSSSNASAAVAEALRVGIFEANEITRESSKEANKVARLKVILEFGSPEQKAVAMEELMNM